MIIKTLTDKAADNRLTLNFVDGASGGAGDGVDESWGPPLDAGLEFMCSGTLNSTESAPFTMGVAS